MTAPTVVLRIDLAGTAFGGTPSWTTVADADLLTGPSFPIDISWGAQDEQSEPSPRTCTFYLENADGAWTPGNASADAQWDIGCRVNVRVTYNAVTYDRFDGYVDSIEPTWPGGKPSWSVVRVSCTDVSARLGIGQPLRSMYEHECIADGASGYWPFDDESTRNFGSRVDGQPVAKRVNSKYGSASLEAGVSSPNMPDILGLGFTSPDANGTAGTTGNGDARGSVLKLVDPLPTSGPFTIEILSQAPNEAITNREMILTKWNEVDTNKLLWLYWGSTGPSLFVSNSLADSGFVLGTASRLDGEWHHLVVTCASDDKTFELFDNGESLGTVTLTNAWSTPSDAMQLGGYIGNAVDGYYGSYMPYSGALAGLATYSSVLADATILEHAQIALGTVSESTDTRFVRVAGYSGVTVSGLPSGQGTCGAQSTRGVSVTEALAKVARTEGTRAWVKGDGSFTFEARNNRYWPTAGLSLTGSDIRADSFAVRRDRQGFANEATASRDGGSAQRYVDSTSQTAVGRFDAGSFDVCPSTDQDALDLAGWKVTTSKVAKTRLPSLTLDLYSLTNTTTVANCLTATVGTYVALTGLPSNAPSTSMNLFVEGATERIGKSEWSISFFTSPEPTDSTGAAIQTLRADAAASSRTVLDNGLVIPL